MLEFGRSVVELVREIPQEPTETRALRLTLAVIELVPEAPPGYVAMTIRRYSETVEGAERAAADELRRAVWGTTTSARLIRFKAMLQSALAILDAQRVKSSAGELQTNGA